MPAINSNEPPTDAGVQPSPVSDIQPQPARDLLERNICRQVTITPDKWEWGTSLSASTSLDVRSPLLSSVDQAVVEYHAQNGSAAALETLDQALNAWLADKASSPGKVSSRETKGNRPGVIADLKLQILSAKAYNAQLVADAPEASNSAFEVVRLAEQTSVKRILSESDGGDPAAGGDAKLRRLILKNETAEAAKAVADALAVTSVASAVKSTVGNAGKDYTQQVHDALAKVGNGVKLTDIFQTDAALDAFVSGVSTLLGAVTSPIELLQSIVGTVLSAYEGSVVGASGPALKPDPKDGPGAALKAIQKMIDRETEAQGKQIAKVAGKIVATWVIPVAGVVLGEAVTGIAGLFDRAHRMSREQAEMAAGQKLLAAGNVDPVELFEACPLLACYFLALADTSVLLNWAHADLYRPGFTQNMDALVIRLAPIIEKAREFIRKSDYALNGTEGLNGLEWYATIGDKKVPTKDTHKLEYYSKLFSSETVLRWLASLRGKASDKAVLTSPETIKALDAEASRWVPDLSHASSSDAVVDPTVAPAPPVPKQVDPLPPTPGDGDGKPLAGNLDAVLGLLGGMGAEVNTGTGNPPPKDWNVDSVPVPGSGKTPGGNAAEPGKVEDDPGTDKSLPQHSADPSQPAVVTAKGGVPK